jgi:hypothetical protein
VTLLTSGKNIKSDVINTSNVRFEASGAINIKISILRDVTSCSVVNK